MSQELEKSIKNYCSRCNGDTNHTVLYEKEIYYNVYHASHFYMTLECKGCEHVSYRTELHDYESSYPDHQDNWKYDITTNTYPRTLKNYQTLIDIYSVPDKIQRVYTEAISAFSANCFLLTAVAFRTVIEAVCIDKEIKGKNLGAKIDNLLKNHFITEKEAQRLHGIRFIGNDSVHEMTVPTEKQLYIVLEIVDHLLRNLYTIDRKANKELDTIISEFHEFKDLVQKSLAKFKVGDEYPLAKFLGKDIRRLGGRILQFETELIKEIQEGKYEEFEIGKREKFGDSQDELQHFKILRIWTPVL
jgi:hypothetical protein